MSIGWSIYDVYSVIIKDDRQKQQHQTNEWCGIVLKCRFMSQYKNLCTATIWVVCEVLLVHTGNFVCVFNIIKAIIFIYYLAMLFVIIYKY